MVFNAFLVDIILFSAHWHGEKTEMRHRFRMFAVHDFSVGGVDSEGVQ